MLYKQYLYLPIEVKFFELKLLLYNIVVLNIKVIDIIKVANKIHFFKENIMLILKLIFGTNYPMEHIMLVY